MSDENCFTHIFFKKFPLIEEKTIKVLIANGFNSKELLLFLDLDKDLPMLEIQLAQRSLLRKILSEFKESHNSLLKSFDQKLSEELEDIDNSCEQKCAINVKQDIQSPDMLSIKPKLTPIGSSLRSQPFTPTPSTSCELVPVASTSSDDCLFIQSTSRQTLLSIPSSSRHNMGSFNRPKNVRRFVRIKAIPRKKQRHTVITSDPKTCDKSTDSRYKLRKPFIKTEVVPVFNN